MSAERRCGRIGSHEPHQWTARSFGRQPMRSYDCPGRVVIEGGHEQAEDDIEEGRLRARDYEAWADL